MNWRRAGIVLGLVLVLAVGNLAVARFERVIHEGQPLVLALAPVDPRSLMQGDYMVLRFEASAQIDEAVDFVADAADGATARRPGYALFRAPTPEAPAQWVGLLDTLGPLQPGEVAVRLSYGRDGPRFGTDAFFFEEGKGEHFAAARFGEFRVDAAGTAILVGLRDGEGRAL